jgi:hypothetical protein
MSAELAKLIETKGEDEVEIVADPRFQAGLSYGKPRPGHPEGKVVYHINEVLANIEERYPDGNLNISLRLIALVHDTFKYQVDRKKPKAGANHHGALAEAFAREYFSNEQILFVINQHDEAYNSWCKGYRDNRWDSARNRANRLIFQLIKRGCLDLYLTFYECDNATGNKDHENYRWFKESVLDNYQHPEEEKA